MKLPLAVSTSGLLLSSSAALLLVADEATDATAIAGGVGVVVSGALLGLTMLAWRWRTTIGGYVRTQVEQATGASDVYAALAALIREDAGGDAPDFEDTAAAV